MNLPSDAGLRFAMIEEGVAETSTAVLGQQHRLAAIEDAGNVAAARAKGRGELGFDPRERRGRGAADDRVAVAGGNDHRAFRL